MGQRSGGGFQAQQRSPRVAMGPRTSRRQVLLPVSMALQAFAREPADACQGIAPASRFPCCAPKRATPRVSGSGTPAPRAALKGRRGRQCRHGAEARSEELSRGPGWVQSSAERTEAYRAHSETLAGEARQAPTGASSSSAGGPPGAASSAGGDEPSAAPSAPGEPGTWNAPKLPATYGLLPPLSLPTTAGRLCAWAPLRTGLLARSTGAHDLRPATSGAPYRLGVREGRGFFELSCFRPKPGAGRGRASLAVGARLGSDLGHHSLSTSNFTATRLPRRPDLLLLLLSAKP